MPNRKLELAYKYFTAPQVAEQLGLSLFQLKLRMKHNVLPAPTFIDPDTSVRYFDEQWLRTAKAILENSIQVKKVPIIQGEYTRHGIKVG